ncbi:MAG TPA: PaaI family thioesterase [Ruminiclostridium sp.]|nr:PaaI family thioesterase [Ruminiclostridium sp.]
MDDTLDMSIIYDLFKKDRFAVENDMKITKAEPGYAEARMEIGDKHLNGYGSVQGGAMFTLADYAFAAASNAKGYATVSSGASISFFHPPKGSYITAKAQEVSSGRKLCTYNVDIFDEFGTLVARYTGSGYIKNIKITDI